MNKSSLAILVLLLSYSINIVAQENNKTNGCEDTSSSFSFLKKNDPILNHIEIISTNDNYISIDVPNGLDSRSKKEFALLLQKFQSNLQKLESKLPEYEFYSIEYVDGVLLEISEVIGKEVYQLSNDSILNDIKHSNTCTLRGGSNKIVILFSEIGELLDDQLSIDINEANSSLLDKRSKIKRGIIPNLETYRYDAKSKSSNANKANYLEIAFLADFDFNGTYLRDRFFYDLRLTPYININKIPRLYFGITLSTFYSFSTQTQEQVTTGFLGPSFGFKESNGSFSQIEFLWKGPDDDNLLNNTNTKLGVSFRRNNINYGFDWYDLLSDDQIRALSIGFSF